MTGAWIVFEGPDGAGKTTLAAKAATILADPRTPGGGPTVLHHLVSTSEFEEYDRPRMWTRAGLNVVQDRCLLSDLTYAPVMFGGPSRMGEERVRRQLKLHALEVGVVHVTASEDELLERMRVRADGRPGADPDPAQVHAVLKNYWREVGWWRDNGASVYEVDTSGGNFPEGLELEMLLSLLMEEMAAERGG